MLSSVKLLKAFQWTKMTQSLTNLLGMTAVPNIFPLAGKNVSIWSV